MCGVAGILCADSHRGRAAMRVMLDRQSHRGPDGEGVESFDVPNGTLVLGHRRLSILDLTEAGRQPMRNPDIGDWITYNGEIYNYPELRKQFESDGERFRSNCDTEVILHAYARWGPDCFRYLKGMYAAAIYDVKKRRLVIARDPLGIKPLYYAAGPSGVAFASELRALHASGIVDDSIDGRAIAGLLAYGSVPGPVTMYRGARLLAPGTRMCIDLTKSLPTRLDELTSEVFWSFPQQDQCRSRETTEEELAVRLKDAVRSHLLSDVPVGVFLSAGMDSTAIAALAAETGGDPINTFTIGQADHPELDENPVAEKSASLFGARHKNIALVDSEICDLAAGWLQTIDQPSIDGLNTYVISHAVRQAGIKVALSGLGGDELFAGYSTFRDVPRYLSLLQLAGWLPLSARRGLANVLLVKKTPNQRAKATEFLTTPVNVKDLVLRRRRVLSDKEITGLGLSATELNVGSDYLVPQLSLEKNIEGMDVVSAISVIESRYYMGNTLLRDSDSSAMAHGLEIRVPMLDQELLEFVSAIPGSMRLGPAGTNKPLLSNAIGKTLMRDIPLQPKRGFSLPYAKWMVGPLRDQFESNLDAVKISGVIDGDRVDSIWTNFLTDQRASNWTRPWLLGVLGAWITNGKSSLALGGTK